MNELAVQGQGPMVTADQKDLVMKTVCNGATETEASLFFYDCSRQGVHPLDRLLHFTKRGGRYVPITSIDFLRMKAGSTKEYAGSDDAVYTGAPGKPGFEAKVAVYRMVQGQRCAWSATARWEEYYPGDAQGHMWQKMKHVMLAKCAEALALRKAFADVLHGLYIREEMDQAEKPTRDTRSLKEKVQAKLVTIEPESHGEPAKIPAIESTAPAAGTAAPVPVGEPSGSPAPSRFIWQMGKHRDKEIEKLPVDYLIWAVDNISRQDHKDAAREELERRNAEQLFQAEEGAEQ